jgi:hypothetical protein
MSFHPAKCTVIHISTNRRNVIDTRYFLHGHRLEVVDSRKYLGVTLSEDLSWRKHVEATSSKASRTLDSCAAIFVIVTSLSGSKLTPPWSDLS